MPRPTAEMQQWIKQHCKAERERRMADARGTEAVIELDFDKELAVCEAVDGGDIYVLEKLSDRRAVGFVKSALPRYAEALRRLKRLRELMAIGGSLGIIASQDHWDEIRELLNIERNL